MIALLAVLLSDPVLLARRQAEHDRAVVAQNYPSTSSRHAAKELDGTSGTAEYGPPYNHNGEGQHARVPQARRNGSA